MWISQTKKKESTLLFYLCVWVHLSNAFNFHHVIIGTQTMIWQWQMLPKHNQTATFQCLLLLPWWRRSPDYNSDGHLIIVTVMRVIWQRWLDFVLSRMSKTHKIWMSIKYRYDMLLRPLLRSFKVAVYLCAILWDHTDETQQGLS